MDYIGNLLIGIKKFFLTNPRLAMMVRISEKMNKERKLRILKAANSFIKGKYKWLKCFTIILATYAEQKLVIIKNTATTN